MAKTIIRRFRLTEKLDAQLQHYLHKENLELTSLITNLIEIKLATEFNRPVDPVQLSKLKPKRAKVIQRPAPKLDPELLLGMGGILNNTSNIAKALDQLCNHPARAEVNLDLIECLSILVSIQSQLNDFLAELPQDPNSTQSAEKRIAHTVKYIEQERQL